MTDLPDMNLYSYYNHNIYRNTNTLLLQPIRLVVTVYDYMTHQLGGPDLYSNIHLLYKYLDPESITGLKLEFSNIINKKSPFDPNIHGVDILLSNIYTYYSGIPLVQVATAPYIMYLRQIINPTLSDGKPIIVKGIGYLYDYKALLKSVMKDL